MENYQALHARSIRDPEGFWAEQAGLIDWQTPCTRVLEYSKPPFANSCTSPNKFRLHP